MNNNQNNRQNPNNRRSSPNRNQNYQNYQNNPNNKNNQNNRTAKVNQSGRSSHNNNTNNNYKKPQKRAAPKKKRTQHRGTSPLVTFAFRFFLFLIFFAAISAVCLAVFFFTLTGLKTPPDILYTVNAVDIKEDDDKPKDISLPFTLSHDIGYANGQYYFPINNIMERMEFISAGDKNEISFIRTKSDEYIKFIMDSNVAYINDEEYHLPGSSFSDENNIIYVPLEFLRNAFENLTFTFDEKNKNKITVDVGDIEKSCFKIRKIKNIDPVPESEAPYFSSDPINFISDLKEYEKYFNPPADSAAEYIILINQTHPLEQDYIPPDLTDAADTRKDGRPVQQLRLYPAKALEAFLIEARANGFTDITVTSAYRGYDAQAQLFAQKVADMRPAHGDNAETVAATAVAYPGQSEHQSGLCTDMHNLASAGINFGDTPDGKWLAANAHFFGFILRYPKDKTDITGIMYEPWHFRYVGRYHATKMYDAGLCFEEYWEQYLKK